MGKFEEYANRQAKIKEYEQRVGMTAEEFKAKWLDGEINDSFEANHFHDLLERSIPTYEEAFRVWIGAVPSDEIERGYAREFLKEEYEKDKGTYRNFVEKELASLSKNIVE